MLFTHLLMVAPPIGSHSESFSVRIMRIELTTVSQDAGSLAGIVTLSDLTATWILV